MSSSFSEKSKFHLYRSKYQPKVPEILTQPALIPITKDAEILPQIAQIFPNIVKFGVKSVSFQPKITQKQIKEGQDEEKPKQIVNALRIGCVLSGGQAAGGHNVIVGIYDYIKRRHKSSQLFGFLNGPKGIFTGKYSEINEQIIEYFRNRGGFDMICSGRDKIQKPQQFQMALKYCESLKLDGLVVIGGDDSNTNAALLAQYFLSKGSNIRVIGCPKTIDGDLKNQFVEVSFGFDTACKTYSQCIGSIMADTLSSKKYYHFIRLMGRSASHIALECALLTKPNYVFIGEEVQQKNQTLKELVEQLVHMISERQKSNKNYGIILIPEGLIEFIPEINKLISEINKLMANMDGKQLQQIREYVLANLTGDSRTTFQFLPKEISDQLLLDRDPHGNVQVAKIQTEKLIIELVKRELSKIAEYNLKKFNSLTNYFGYEGRCGFPTNFDCDYCYSLGLNAAAIIQSGQTGLMSCIRGLSNPPQKWLAGGYPLVTMMNIENRKGKDVPVIKKALVELDGPLFKLYQSKRKQWALGDFYCMLGPIQFQFQMPIPYLAVTPAQKNLQINIQSNKNIQKAFSKLEGYNFNSLSFKLSQQDQQIPEILNKDNIEINFSLPLKYHSKEVSSAIKSQYQFLWGNDNRLISFSQQLSSEATGLKKIRIGVSFNGRQFPGGHNILNGLYSSNVQLIGFVQGNKGIFNQNYITLDKQVLKLFNNHSGFFLLGRNSDKLRDQDQLQKALEVCKKLQLDGLVLIGASHTLTDATIVSDYFLKNNSQTKVIGIPASIDNNIGHQYLQTCVGFATSAHTYSTLISNLMIDASSNTKYWYFIRLMGRDPSHLVLESALSTHPNYTIISEQVRKKGWDIDQLVDDIVRVIIKRSERGLGFGCIVIPEGLPHYLQSLRRIKVELDQIGNSNQKQELHKKMSQWAYARYEKLPDFIKTQLTKRDNSGALAYSQIQTEKMIAQLVGRKLKQLKSEGKYKGSFSPVCHFFGYQGRCSVPSRFDQNLGATYGRIAQILIQKGVTGYCPSVRGLQKSPQKWFPLAIPLTNMLHIKVKSQFGNNKAIIDSADVNLKSHAFRYFKEQREAYQLVDHYESPGPIQFYGESSRFIPLTINLQQKYDFQIIEEILVNLDSLKSRTKFGIDPKILKLIRDGLRGVSGVIKVVEGQEDFDE